MARRLQGQRRNPKHAATYSNDFMNAAIIWNWKGVYLRNWPKRESSLCRTHQHQHFLLCDASHIVQTYLRAFEYIELVNVLDDDDNDEHDDHDDHGVYDYQHDHDDDVEDNDEDDEWGWWWWWRRRWWWHQACKHRSKDCFGNWWATTRRILTKWATWADFGYLQQDVRCFSSEWNTLWVDTTRRLRERIRIPWIRMD